MMRRLLSSLSSLFEDAQLRKAHDALLASEQRYALVAQGAGEAIWDWDSATDAMRISPRFLTLLGHDPGFLKDLTTWGTLVHPDDFALINRNLIAHLKGESDHFGGEFRFKCGDGQYRWLVTRGIAARDAAGRAVRMGGSFRDITESKQTEIALRESEARLKLIIENVPAMIAQISRDYHFIFLNRRHAEMFGGTPADLIGRHLTEVLGDAGFAEIRQHFDSVHSGNTVTYQRVASLPGGRSRHLEVALVPDRKENGEVCGSFGLVMDITERKLAQERIEHLATRDALTGLPNRLLLNDRLEHALAAAQRNGEIVAVLFIDLDRFKTINDSLGHHVGDELLRQATQRLALCVRKEDTLSRLGGDEFVAALSGLRETQDAAVVAKKILQALAQPYAIEGHTLNTSCSIGISIYPNDGQDVSILTRNADTAMYHAKENGRNNYQYFSHDMNVRVVERLDLENALRLALERGEFVLHYQPQVEMKSGKVVGAEALIRWQRPGSGLIFPDTFIRVAEESGLIVPIGEWALATACAQGRAWADAGFSTPRIAVNLSVRQVNRKLARTVDSILKTSGLDPDQLDLEITESLLMHNIEDTIVALQDLHHLGVKISIDDFGTGHSSLSYLQRLPIDVLKVDRAFVRDLGVSRNAAAIVSAILAMAKILQLKVIAEGVETSDQMEILKGMGCDEYQGYLFGKPVPAEEFTRRFLFAKL